MRDEDVIERMRERMLAELRAFCAANVVGQAPRPFGVAVDAQAFRDASCAQVDAAVARELLGR